MADIFISYAHDDRARIARLAEALEKDGHSVWWDRHIAGGAEFSEDIERELEAASAVIVAWSAKSVASRWVRDEAGIAANADKLVAISLDGSEPPIGFKQLHAIDFSDDSLEAMQDLERSLALKLGAERSVAPELVHAPKAGARKWVAMLAAVAALFVIGLGGWLWLDRSGGNAGQSEAQVLASVAVLPFVATSSGEDDQYFADGLSEEVLNRLDALSELHVASRTASFYFKNEEVPLNEMAERLGVGYLVEGTLRREGDRWRISARLLNAADGQALWSNSYDAEGESALDVQADIAEKVALSLDVVLDDGKRSLMAEAGVDNHEAFAIYAKASEQFAYAHTQLHDLSILAETVPLFEQAFAMDKDLWAAPFFAADYYSHLIIEDLMGVRRDQTNHEDPAATRAKFRALLGQALEAAKRPVDRARIRHAMILTSDDWSQLRAVEERAIGDTSCFTFLFSFAPSAPFGERQDRWIEAMRKIRNCDRTDQGRMYELVNMMIWSGQLDEAERIVGRHQPEEEQGVMAVASTQFDIFLARGELDRALELAEREGLSPLLSLMASGDVEGLEALVGSFAEISPEQAAENFGLTDTLIIAARMGQRDWANRAASLLDAKPDSAFLFLGVIINCRCGAPFDLSATPNFAAQFRQTGLQWPPKSPIQWPAKDW